MFNKQALYSSKRTNWKTPVELFKTLNRLYNFDFDPCPVNHDFDGLVTEWKKSNFVNPPYGRAIARWIKKGFDESRKGKTVVMLVPSRTDTRWWHEHIMKAKEIWFIKGRLKFGNQKNSAPFPSAVVIFKKKTSHISPIIRTFELWHDTDETKKRN